MRSRLRSRFTVGVGTPFLAAAVLCAALAQRPAHAFEQFVGTRALGMGGALRGAAAAGAGPLLNPSGMSLERSYNVEADYQYASVLHEHDFHGSVVDSTSSFGLAGGFYYTYHTDNPPGVGSGTGHEGGLALSLPFGDRVSVGGTLKYFRLSGDQVTADGGTGGITYDAGVTIRPARSLSLGLVGMNLRNLHAGVAPLAFGYGAAFVPADDVMFVLDGVTNFSADAPLPRKATRIMGGLEILFEKTFALRAGGGYDGVSQNGFFTAGLSAVSEAGALDLGVRQDAFRNGDQPRQTIVGVAFRLFVPQP
jgi:hypothetical protein